jgi:hypothetical protein
MRSKAHKAQQKVENEKLSTTTSREIFSSVIEKVYPSSNNNIRVLLAEKKLRYQYSVYSSFKVINMTYDC